MTKPFVPYDQRHGPDVEGIDLPDVVADFVLWSALVDDLIRRHEAHKARLGECAARTALVLNGASKLSPPSGGPSTFAAAPHG